MKQTLLIITAVMLVVGFTSGQEPIDGSTLVYKDDLMYAPGSDKPYSGVAVWYNSGQKEYESTYKDGELDGVWTQWYENGQKEYERTYKDGEQIGETKRYESINTDGDDIVDEDEPRHKEY